MVLKITTNIKAKLNKNNILDSDKLIKERKLFELMNKNIFSGFKIICAKGKNNESETLSEIALKMLKKNRIKTCFFLLNDKYFLNSKINASDLLNLKILCCLTLFSPKY